MSNFAQAICRDSWALHLSLLLTPPNPEPYLYAQEQGGFGSQEQVAKDQNTDNNDEHGNPDEGDTANNEGVDGEDAGNGESDSASRGDEDSETEPNIPARNRDGKSEVEKDSEPEPEPDPGMQTLLNQMSEGNSDDEDEGDDGDDAREGRSREVAKGKNKLELRSRKKGKPSWRRDDTPAGTVAVLVYACWTMRVPVIYQDFIR